MDNPTPPPSLPPTPPPGVAVRTDGIRRGSILDVIERIGNALPEPAILFAMLAALIVVASAIGASASWSVQPVRLTVEKVQAVDAAGVGKVGSDGAPMMVPKLSPAGKPITSLQPVGAPLQPRNLLTTDGIYWMFSSAVRNFTGLPALGLVFVAMLGIGLAEKFGLFSALMRQLALATPKSFLTPMVVFIGANASVASDAGYIILPPLAAALYLAVGRHPVAGLAAAFAGVAGGFGGGMFPTAADGFLAGVATDAARIIEPGYPDVEATHNLYFKIGSAFVVMFCGWVVTDKIIEPRLKRTSPVESSDTSAMTELALTVKEKVALGWAMVTMAGVLIGAACLVLVPGAPLHGAGLPTLASGQVLVQQPIRIVATEGLVGMPKEQVLAKGEVNVIKAEKSTPRLLEAPGDRWSQAIVPIILLVFMLPGMVYGAITGRLRTQRDFIDAIYHGIKSIVPVLAIAFFMGQFVNYFTYTGLDRMLAFAGGSLLVQADLPVPLLLVLFVLLVVAGDFAMSGMLSKFGVMAPIFIPMFMMVGMSPELTTAAYRIGDSVVNIVTPLNSYLLIILVVLQKYSKNAALGSLISLMLPYSLVFGVVWTAFLLAWYFLGLPLGTGAGLHYVPELTN